MGLDRFRLLWVLVRARKKELRRMIPVKSLGGGGVCVRVGG